MEITNILVTLHLIGFAFGVGGATVSDMIFLRSVRDNRLSQDKFDLIKTVSKVVWTSVALLLLSGAALIALEYQANNGTIPRLDWVFFQIKLTAFAVLVLNGIVFHSVVFPAMKKTIGREFFSEAIKHRLWMFALTGGISIVSWYSAFLSVAFGRFLADFSYLLLLNIYLLLIVGAASSAYFVLHMYSRGKADLVAKFKKLIFSLAFIALVGFVVYIINDAVS
ncbi:MAG: hypothetical protein WD061_03405 [Candidatus Saccharimonadales bacterium]